MYDIAWANPVAIWVPTALVILIAALGLTAAGSPPAQRGARRLWLIAIFLFGSLAVAGTVWQAQGTRERAFASAAAPDLGRAATQGGAVARDTAALQARAKALQDQIAKLQQHQNARRIAPDVADRLADDLKKSGSRQVVVSAIPGNVEAYDYADQLVGVLRKAGWKADGPETTRAFGDIRAVGVNLFANPATPSDAPKILAAAFDKFNIPYAPRVTPSGVVPDSDAVELFVGALPGTRIAAAAPEKPAPAAAPPPRPIESATAGQRGGNPAGKAVRQQ